MLHGCIVKLRHAPSDLTTPVTCYCAPTGRLRLARGFARLGVVVKGRRSRAWMVWRDKKWRMIGVVLVTLLFGLICWNSCWWNVLHLYFCPQFFLPLFRRPSLKYLLQQQCLVVRAIVTLVSTTSADSKITFGILRVSLCSRSSLISCRYGMEVLILRESLIPFKDNACHQTRPGSSAVDPSRRREAKRAAAADDASRWWGQLCWHHDVIVELSTQKFEILAFFGCFKAKTKFWIGESLQSKSTMIKEGDQFSFVDVQSLSTFSTDFVADFIEICLAIGVFKRLS